MKRFLFGIGILSLVTLATLAFIYPKSPTTSPDAPETNEEFLGGKINWLTWDEAVKANDKNPKKIFVDLYTHWCGWCKKMDNTTFAEPEVVQYINDNFYAVKFNAEQKEDIQWRGNTFKFVASGRRGVHQLAYSLLDGRLGYPSYVYLTEKMDRVTISPGYKDKNQLMTELVWVAEDHFRTTPFKEFAAKN